MKHIINRTGHELKIPNTVQSHQNDPWGASVVKEAIEVRGRVASLETEGAFSELTYLK